MIKQQTVICLYQNNCKDGESLGRQKQACRQAVNKLFWNIRAELICDQDADVPLMCRNAMQEARQQAKDGTYTVLMISREEDLQKCSIMTGCGARIVLRSACTLRPLPLLRFDASAAGGAHLRSTKYYLRILLSRWHTSPAISARRIIRCCLKYFLCRDRGLTSVPAVLSRAWFLWAVTHKIHPLLGSLPNRGACWENRRLQISGGERLPCSATSAWLPPWTCRPRWPACGRR